MRLSASALVPSLLAFCLIIHAGAADAGAGVVTQDGVPGGIAVAAVETVGTVTAIDPAARTLTIRNEAGKESSITAGPDAVNLPQIKVGDAVRLLLVEQLVVAVGDAANAPADAAAAGVALAPEGAKPAGVVAKTVRVTATVTAIDVEKHLATLTFPDGTAKTLRVRPDVDLKARKVGESVTFVLTEAIALKIEEAGGQIGPGGSWRDTQQRGPTGVIG
ncbi:MAG: hypothetical protein QM820_12235 [Minicystis sp.]